MNPKPLLEMVRSMITIDITDVVHVGTTSMIYIRAVNTKMAMVLCMTGVRPSIPKNDVGTTHKKIVSARTIPSAMRFFIESFLVPISIVVLDCKY